MANQKTQNLGSDSIPKLLAKLAVPAVVAQVVNLLYNIVDRIYIGHMADVGAAALTGVGLFAPILMLINAFATLAGAGGAPKAAISMGARDNKTAEKILGNCFSVLMIFAAVLTAVFYAAAPTLLRLFGASDATLPYAVEYARIYILGTVFVLIVMGMNPFITTQGFAKISMMTTLIGAVINIVLDPIFIFVLNLGVRGAALATVLSQAVGAVWILRFLTGQKTILHLTKDGMKLEGKIILPCLALGASTFVMLSTESLLSISFTSSLSRYGGDLAVGAMTIMTSVYQLVMMPMTGVCQGAQPIISFNFGAGNQARVKQAFRGALAVCLTYAVLFWLAIMTVPEFFAGIFTRDTALAEYTAWAMRIYLAGVFAFGAQSVCQHTFMSLGQAKTSLLIACQRKIVMLIPLIFILPLFMENKAFAVFLAEPVSDIVSAVVAMTCMLLQIDKILAKGAAQAKST